MAVELAAQAIDPDRLADVVEAALPQVVEGIGRGPADLLEQHGADIDGVRFAVLLDTSGEVDPVADQIVALDQHVGQMQAKAHMK